MQKGAEKHQFIRDVAAQEIGLRCFLEAKGAKAFTTSFNELEGMKQLMGRFQRLMAEGYGFGAEGDWKSALVRTMWIMVLRPPGWPIVLRRLHIKLFKENSTILHPHMLEINLDIVGGVNHG